MSLVSTKTNPKTFKSSRILCFVHQFHLHNPTRMLHKPLESAICASLLLQICNYFSFAVSATLFDFDHRLLVPDQLLTNFPRRYNFTRVLTRYLPPEVPEFISLPEVIDNRGAVVNSTRTLNSPQFELQPPLQFESRDSRFYKRPDYAHTKQASQPMDQLGSVKEQDHDPPYLGVKISDMSCQNMGEDVFFRATIKPQKMSDTPVVENSMQETCRTKKFNDEYRIEFDKDQFWACGVVDCSTDVGKFYCLTVRFSVVPGLKLKNDYKITLQCKVQERIASHTKRINVKTFDTSARMAPRVIIGGTGNSLETDVSLFRKTYNSENIFDTRIESGGAVILGEEILLRVLVKEDDGWRYSRMSDVTVHYVEKQQRKKIMNSLWILDANGCLNPDVRDVCSREQYRVSPLESYLVFQAFMFENMKPSDEMVLSVKVTGCLDGADCVVNCPSGHVRRARSIVNNNQTVNWQDDISFRVVYTPDELDQLQSVSLVALYAVFILVIIIIILILAAIKLFFRKRIVKE